MHVDGIDVTGDALIAAHGTLQVLAQAELQFHDGRVHADYTSTPAIYRTHPAPSLDLEYGIAAIRQLTKRTDRDHLYIISDLIEYRRMTAL